VALFLKWRLFSRENTYTYASVLLVIMLAMKVIGITGTLGAGKGTIAEYLVQKKGFNHYSVSDYITEEVKKRGLEINRDAMYNVGWELKKKFGPEYIVKELYKKAKADGKNAIIESIRSPGEIV